MLSPGYGTPVTVTESPPKRCLLRRPVRPCSRSRPGGHVASTRHGTGPARSPALGQPDAAGGPVATAEPAAPAAAVVVLGHADLLQPLGGADPLPGSSVVP